MGASRRPAASIYADNESPRRSCRTGIRAISPALLVEVKHPLGAGMAEIATPELRGGAPARELVADEHREHGPVAQAHDVRRVDRREQFSGVGLGYFRRPAFHNAEALTANGEGRVERDSVPCDHAVKESGAGRRGADCALRCWWFPQARQNTHPACQGAICVSSPPPCFSAQARKRFTAWR